MPAEPWYQHCIDTIDARAKLYPRRLKIPDIKFLNDMRPRIKVGLGLSPGQEKYLLGLHEKMTEPVRIKWR